MALDQLRRAFRGSNAGMVPYLLKPDPERAERYRKMFGNTHSFLPRRNGMVPNTAHILLHLATAATLLCLLLNDFQTINRSTAANRARGQL